MNKNIDNFFSAKRTTQNIYENEEKNTIDYLAPIKAFARTTYKSIHIIDYEKKGFEYVSDNPFFLYGHTAEEVQKLGCAFYFKHITKPDLDLIYKINTIGFDFYESLPVEERLLYTFSYDFNIKNQEYKTILINKKLTPLFLNKEGKIWKAICIIALSTEQKPGNLKIHKQEESKIFTYNLEDGFWKTQEKIILTKREKEILQYSARGFKINEIAKTIFVSPDTIKFHRKKLFDKLNVANITEAISFAFNNNIL